MVETVLVSNDADVFQAAEEDQRAKFVLLVRSRRREPAEQRAGTATLERDSGSVEDTPHEAGTIEPIWTFRAPAITSAESLVDGG